MKVCFDTSVIVAALLDAHAFHARAIIWVEAVVSGRLEGLVSAHGLAETWSVLTRYPSSPPISGTLANRLIERLRKHFVCISMSDAIYRHALQRCSERGARSGAVFDALHLCAAESAGATLFLTFNEADFTRLTDSKSPRIVVPPDPPRVIRRA